MKCSCACAYACRAWGDELPKRKLPKSCAFPCSSAWQFTFNCLRSKNWKTYMTQGDYYYHIELVQNYRKQKKWSVIKRLKVSNFQISTWAYWSESPTTLPRKWAHFRGSTTYEGWQPKPLNSPQIFIFHGIREYPIITLHHEDPKIRMMPGMKQFKVLLRTISITT